MSPVTLMPMAKAIPLIWDAFNKQQLQAQTQTNSAGGQYSGPCAIGVLFSPEQRVALDEAESYMVLNHAVQEGYVVLENRRELADYMQLQSDHDEWLQNATLESLNNFVLTLNSLSEKYPAA